MILKNGQDWQPTVSDIRIMKRTFPQIDLELEFNKMELWCYSNPAKRKTQRGMLRFATSWLSRAKDPIVSSRSTTLQQDLNDTSWAMV